jgi:hypothetical protein
VPWIASIKKLSEPNIAKSVAMIWATEINKNVINRRCAQRFFMLRIVARVLVFAHLSFQNGKRVISNVPMSTIEKEELAGSSWFLSETPIHLE